MALLDFPPCKALGGLDYLPDDVLEDCEDKRVRPRESFSGRTFIEVDEFTYSDSLSGQEVDLEEDEKRDTDLRYDRIRSRNKINPRTFWSFYSDNGNGPSRLFGWADYFGVRYSISVESRDIEKAMSSNNGQLSLKVKARRLGRNYRTPVQPGKIPLYVQENISEIIVQAYSEAENVRYRNSKFRELPIMIIPENFKPSTEYS